jgi:hypothetical protein
VDQVVGVSLRSIGCRAFCIARDYRHGDLSPVFHTTRPSRSNPVTHQRGGGGAVQELTLTGRHVAPKPVGPTLHFVGLAHLLDVSLYPGYPGERYCCTVTSAPIPRFSSKPSSPTAKTWSSPSNASSAGTGWPICARRKLRLVSLNLLAQQDQS